MATITPYAGTSARILVAAVAPNLTVDSVDFTLALANLAAGRPSALAKPDMMAWSINFASNDGKFVTFESPGDSEGQLYAEPVRGGIAQWGARLEAPVSSNMIFQAGQFLAMDFIWKKGAPNKGYLGCTVKVKSVGPSTSVNDPYAKYAVEIEGFGPLPVPTF